MRPLANNDGTRFARGPTMRDWFRKFAHWAALAAGSPGAFFVALLAVAGWALTGPAFGYSDSWQLVINTSTTIVTFLMVFLIQNTQNRDEVSGSADGNA